MQFKSGLNYFLNLDKKLILDKNINEEIIILIVFLSFQKIN